MITKKKTAEPPSYHERLHALAEAQNWPSVPVDPAAAPSGAGLPDGLPPWPAIAAPPPEVNALKARVVELTEEAASFEAQLSAAYEAGDPDAVLSLRRAREEAVVRRWAAEQEAVTAELAHYEAESLRIEPYAAEYDRPLEDTRAKIRDLQAQEQALVDAAGAVNGALGKLSSVTARLARQQQMLRRGPTGAATKDGWG